MRLIFVYIFYDQCRVFFKDWDKKWSLLAPRKENRYRFDYKGWFAYHRFASVIRDETEWNLKCRYPREDRKTVVYETRTGVKNVSNVGVIPIDMKIFNAQYSFPLPSPSVFKLRDRVYVQVSRSFFGMWFVHYRFSFLSFGNPFKDPSCSRPRHFLHLDDRLI